MSKPEEMPICPMCGDEVNDFYVMGGNVVGCPHCIRLTDAWEWTEEEKLSRAIDYHYDRAKDRGWEGRQK